MFSFRSILNYFATAFTFSVGGGIGEAALMGALFGGAKAAVTGEDLVQGALLGGVTGGAMSGVGAAIGGLGSAGTNIAADETAKSAITNSMESQLTPFIQAPQLNSLANVPLTATEAVPNMGITAFNSNPDAVSMMQNLGGQAAPAAEAAQFTQAGLDTSPEAMSALQASGQQGIAGVGANPFAPKAPFVGLKEMINPEAGGMVEKGLDFAIKNPYTTTGIGGAAYGAMNPVTHTPDNKEEKSKFAGYNRDEFTPYEAQRPNPYPTAHYAVGGIAALANGGQGMGGNQGYPQGQQDHTQYATPTQMPTSSSVIDSGYEQNTNPYSGEPVGYAAGGQTNYAADAAAGLGPAGGLRATSFRTGDMGMGYLTGNQGYQGMNGMQNANGNNLNYGGIGNLLQSMQSAVRPSFYNQSEFNASPNTGQPNTQIYRPRYAEGGIAGYSLGGYAAGGNPRLLKGPGDGMSDNIPATIGNKQPARLADGEFVVPADVVSHLGNGSTDAGAKHLYNMMDKVRKARTGKKAQGTQINPNKFMPA